MVDKITTMPRKNVGDRVGQRTDPERVRLDRARWYSPALPIEMERPGTDGILAGAGYWKEPTNRPAAVRRTTFPSR
jgi:hypothetical protein